MPGVLHMIGVSPLWLEFHYHVHTCVGLFIYPLEHLLHDYFTNSMVLFSHICLPISFSFACQYTRAGALVPFRVSSWSCWYFQHPKEDRIGQVLGLFYCVFCLLESFLFRAVLCYFSAIAIEVYTGFLCWLFMLVSFAPVLFSSLYSMLFWSF